MASSGSAVRGSTTGLTILGGSSAFLPGLAADLADRSGDLPSLDIRLLGRDLPRTAAVARFCTGVAQARRAPHRYRAATDVADAARGAAVVVNQVRVGGFAARSADERLALQAGYPGDETIGPAGFAAALRSVPPILALARAVERVAPQAWFVQLGNPMSILLDVVLRQTGLRSFGLCELPQATLERALQAIDVPPDSVTTSYLGANHQGWFVRVERDGHDLLPAIFARVAEAEDGGWFGVTADVMRAQRALPVPYLRLYEHTSREVERQRRRPRSRGDELAELSARLHAHYRQATDFDLPNGLGERAMPWNAMTLVPVLVALTGGRPTEAYVSAPNAGRLRGIPDRAIVETRCRVDAGGPAPADDRPLFHVARTPVLARICAFEQAAASATLRPDHQGVVAALRRHPFGIAPDAAEALAACMLEATGAPA
jgi:6-phospho-beta-glucosidase